MHKENLLILERSSQNLKKIKDDDKIILEGVFAEFGRENRNGRVYEEQEYLPHMDYLKKDINNGSLLGELDHPERFEVALGNVSHRVIEMWYDKANRQVRGKVQIIPSTPKGQVAKALLDAGVPLSISSRAAGSVNEDKTVAIQQIYTFDLVAKPGFESAQLQNVNEKQKERFVAAARVLNESTTNFDDKYRNVARDLGVLNENIGIYDVSDSFNDPKIRPEAKSIMENKNKNKIGDKKMEEQFNQKPMTDEALQQWTLYFKKQMNQINEKIQNLERSVVKGNNTSNSGKELKAIKEYVEKLRSVQENALNWQSDIAKAVNKVANYADLVAEKSNEHYDLTNKIVKTVDYNAKALDKTQDWLGENSKVTNALGKTVDYNADMLNNVSEWNTELAKAINALNEWAEEKAKAINKLNEWGEEKAKAVNGLHEWTSSVATGVNSLAGYTEEMLGRAMSKQDAKILKEYVDLLQEAEKNPKLKAKLSKVLSENSITGQKINESLPKGLSTITDAKTVKGTTWGVEDKGKESGVEFDEKSKTIVKRMKTSKLQGGKKPKELQSNDKFVPKQATGNSKSSDRKAEGWLSPYKGGGSKSTPAGGKAGSTKQKGVMTLDIHSGHKSRKVTPSVKLGQGGPSSSQKNNSNMKLDTKPTGKLKESWDRSKSIQDRSSKLDNKLSKIINNVEKEKTLVEKTKESYPFTSILGERDIRNFATLSESDKQKVAKEVAKNPTNNSDIVKKLWEHALSSSENKGEPLWLKTAPKKYRQKFDEAPKQVKESIKAKAEFYDLKTPYQINNFWETSGLIQKQPPKLNESVTAKSPKAASKQMNSFVSQVGEAMKRYSS